MEKRIIKILQSSPRGLTARGLLKRLKVRKRPELLNFSQVLRKLVLKGEIIWTLRHRFKLNQN